MSSNKIYIFKTNIHSESDKQHIHQTLNNHIGIEDWSLDIEDQDKVLRIMTNQLTINNIIDLIAQCGYACEEL